MIKEDLDKLTTNDVYSLILFAILQLRKSPDYSVISELIYAVDKDSLLNLCRQFGGMTITIPTLKEMENVVDALLLYCYVNLEHKSLEESLELCANQNKEEVLSIYDVIIDVISTYDFRRI